MKTITQEQAAALSAFAAKHGRRWKSILLTKWESGKAPAELQGVRNQFGPQWLEKFRLP